MNIDIEPTIQVIESTDILGSLALASNEGHCLYVFVDVNYTNITSMFSADELAKFRPNDTVSNFINTHIKEQETELARYDKMIETGLHYKWKSNVYEEEYNNGYLMSSKVVGEMSQVLNSSDLETIKDLAVKMRVKMGTVQFIKIVGK